MPVVVLHTDPRAARTLADFRSSREPWIVAVNMVSEGVDIPRLRVGVYASAAKTPLIFRQIVGRFVRTIPGSAPEPSWVYLPADPTLRTHASQVESELRHALHRKEPGEGSDEPRERRATEPSPTADFVPLSAEFAAQMTLFGAPQPATTTTTTPPLIANSPALAPSPIDPSALEHEPAPIPAFERRADLRRERSRLVAELARSDGRGHREINAWLNRTIGIERVDAASINQLERSITALVRELTRANRRTVVR
jgi:hypothetical protein